MLDSASVMEICQRFAREICTVPGIQAVVCTIHHMLTIHNGAYIRSYMQWSLMAATVVQYLCQSGIYCINLSVLYDAVLRWCRTVRCVCPIPKPPH